MAHGSAHADDASSDESVYDNAASVWHFVELVKGTSEDCTRLARQ